MEQLKWSMPFDFNKDSNKEGPKFKVGNHVKASKYKIIFAKDNAPDWSEKVFFITKVKNAVPWVYVISDLNGEKLVRTF